MKMVTRLVFSLFLAHSLSAATYLSPDQLPIWGGGFNPHDLIMVTIQNTNTLAYRTYATFYTNMLAGLTNISGGGGTTTNVNTFNSPFVVCFPDGTYYISNQVYTASNTLTAGIQEAINSLPPAANAQSQAGGTIYLAPGNFFTTTNIHLPDNIGSQPFNLHFRGAGMTASGITYVGTNAQTVMSIGAGQKKTPYIFSMENMWLASNTNACTNVLALEGASDAGGTLGGGVARASIKFCYIGMWSSMTNNTCFSSPVFTPSSCTDAKKHNLIGVKVNLNFNDPVSITECSFNYLGTAISWACDHGIIADNTFEQCGKSVGNDWPTSSPYYTGATIAFLEPDNLQNGNKDWRIRGNNFIGCPLHYFSKLFTTDSTNMYYRNINSILIQDDTDESGTAIAATTGNALTFLNPRGSAYIPNALPSYYITNTSDYTSWNTRIASNSPANGSNVVAIIDLRIGTSTVGMEFRDKISSTRIGIGTNNPYYNVDVTDSSFRQMRLVSTNDDSLVLLVPKSGGSNWLFGATATTSGMKSNVLAFATSTSESASAQVKFFFDPSSLTFNVPTKFVTPTNTPLNEGVVFGTGTAGYTEWAYPTNKGYVKTNQLAELGLTTNIQFSLTGTSTNTLYFTNGILYRVSQP